MGTISEKLTYLNGTKQAIKDELNRFGADLDNEDTFRSYSNVINDIYDKLPKVSANGTEFTLENAQNGKLDSFGMDGNTEQTTYSGQQLFNVHDNPKYDQYITLEEDYITCERTNTGTEIVSSQIYTNNLNVQPSTTYLCVCEIIEVSGTGSIKPVSRWVNQNQGQFNYDTAYAFSSLTAGQKLIYPVTTFADLSNKTRGTRTVFEFQAGEGGRIKIRLSILTDTTITSDTFVYEPYVGGTPSPNPDYPQNINVVSGNQVVNVSGKNKLPFPYTQSTITNNGVTFTVNNDGSVLVNGTASANENASIKLYGNYQEINEIPFTGKYLSGGTNVVRLRAFNNTGNIYTVLGNDTGSGAEIDTTTYTKGYIELAVLKGTTADNVLIKPMVLDSLDDTTYEPYQNQDYEIDLGDIELCKIDTYKDSIKKSTGKNLFDKDSVILGKVWNGASNTKRAYGYIEAIQGQVYTASTQDTNSDLKIYITETASVGTGGEHIKQTELTSTLTFTPQSDTKYIVVQFTATTNDITQEMVNNALIQIEENNQATDYEPYGTDWYIKKEIGKVVLDGSESWTFGHDNTSTGYAYFYTSTYDSLIKQEASATNHLCNRLTPVNQIYTNYNDNGNNVATGQSSSNKTRIAINTANSVIELTSWLSNNNVILYFILATPTYETITNETLISQLESIKVNTGSNYFTLSNSNNVLPNIYAKRLKKLDSLT